MGLNLMNLSWVAELHTVSSNLESTVSLKLMRIWMGDPGYELAVSGFSICTVYKVDGLS